MAGRLLRRPLFAIILQCMGPYILLTFLILTLFAGYLFPVNGQEAGNQAAETRSENEPTEKPAGVGETRFTVRTDAEAVSRGEDLFEARCSQCHFHDTTWTLVGPGLQGVLKNPYLPVSKRAASPEAVLKQLRNPYKDMPSFGYLTDDEAENIIAYLNTL